MRGGQGVGSEFTVRAVGTGMVLGSMLSICNIYAGLKIGWGTNVTITAVLLGWAFWGVMQKGFGTRHWGILENNISQTAASAAASIASAGLVAPIPAYAILTGKTLPWHLLAIWVLSVCLVGIAAAIALRRQMLIEEKLPFAQGMATGETLQEIHSHDVEALKRVRMLLLAAAISFATKIGLVLKTIGTIGFPGTWRGISLKSLTFGIDPSLMMFGIGAITGWRPCWSLTAGSILAWGVIAPQVVAAGWVDLRGADPASSWYGPLLKWLLWPGVALMVSSSLTSFAYSWRSVLATFTGARTRPETPTRMAEAGAAKQMPTRADDTIRPRTFVAFLALALVLSVLFQYLLFGIRIWAAVLGVLLSLLLAVVAGRVSGEISVTPVGAMGKVTQMFFGIVTPGDATVNLMAANVTGGAASQCADLLQDLKAGMIVGASPRILCHSQVFGAIAGSLAGSAVYLALIPDPRGMLMTREWPAPAVAQWLAVAEIFKIGFQAMPPGALPALALGALAGFLLATLDRFAPPAIKAWIPSSASLGMAFVIPASNAGMLLCGGLAALLANRFASTWSGTFLIVVSAGLVAGESLAGVGLAVGKMLLP